jgi:hypothetical protein
MTLTIHRRNGVIETITDAKSVDVEGRVMVVTDARGEVTLHKGVKRVVVDESAR